MSAEVRPDDRLEQAHACPLPWPRDPEMPEGHACACGQRWIYQPARWEAVYTVDDLRRQHEDGAYLRGVIPRLEEQPKEGGTALIVPIPSPKSNDPMR